MKTAADNHRRDVNFEPGQWVMVKLRLYRQLSATRTPYSKLAKRFYGPFKILSRNGKVAYKLQHPEDSRIHPIFHCSMLKPFYQTPLSKDKPIALPPQVCKHQPVISPLAIIDTHWEIREGEPCLMVLVQWEGLHPKDTS